MNPVLMLAMWIAAQALHVVLGGIAIWKQRNAEEPKRLGSLKASFFASISPWTTLFLFLGIFVIGGSSNVRQLAGESGYDLWSTWCGSWPLVVFGNLIAIVALPVLALFPPYPPRHWVSFLARWCAVAGAALAWYTVVTYVPDA